MQIEVNGNRVAYQLFGRADAPVVMMSHSLGCSLAMWDPQESALGGDYRVLRYDTRGHGGSGAPEGAYDFDQLGDDAVALMDALEVDRVHWVGLSMGGMIGQNLALRYGDRLRSLVLCNTACVIPAEMRGLWDERIATAASDGMASLWQATVDRWFTGPFLARNPPAVAAIEDLFMATPPAGYIGCCQAIRSLDYEARLGEISQPTLIIVGEDDPATPVSASELIHRGISGSELVVLPNAAHLSSVEQPQAFNQALTGFLAAH